MKLPNGAKATIEERKIREYLLSSSHPIGRFKARAFAAIGFGPENWRAFADALAQLAATGEAELEKEDKYGQKYLVVGALKGPQGQSAEVVSVWIVAAGRDTPRLVTVYPR